MPLAGQVRKPYDQSVPGADSSKDTSAKSTAYAALIRILPDSRRSDYDCTIDKNNAMNEKLEDHKYPKRSHAYATVAVLTVANVIAFIDRQIPAMLVGPIKQDFGLSDSQVALLIGAAFSVFYAVMALPIGYAVDRLRRNQVLGVGIFVWSFMTMSAVFATSYAKLFGARMGVAAGEASIAPTSVSLVSDSFPENQRGKAMGVITAGVYIGVGISLWGGGYLIDYLTRIGGLSLPLIGDVKPWQAVFLIAGLPGFLLSAVVFLMPEPGRSGAANAPSGKTFGKDLLIHINQHRQTLLLMFSGLVFMAIIFYSFSAWAPTMMVRTHAISLAEAGMMLGILTIVCSITGTILAGIAVDRLIVLGYRDAPVRAAMLACLLALPPIVLAPLMESLTLAWILLGFYLLFISSYATLGLLAVSGVAGTHVKGQMTAVFALLMMIFSSTMGPQLTAFFTDFVFADESKLNWSVSLTGGLALPIAAVFFRLSMAHYARSSERISRSL